MIFIHCGLWVETKRLTEAMGIQTNAEKYFFEKRDLFTFMGGCGCGAFIKYIYYNQVF